jgi:hypothetical protein
VTALLAAVLLASLAGSLHCAGMCGAFAAIATTSGGASAARSKLALQGGYHGGRLVGYVAFGAAAGGLGALVDLSGALAGLSSAAAILAGVTLVFFGALELAKQFGLRAAGGHGRPGSAFVARFVGSALRTDRPALRALAVGAASALLPCGWLYAFVVTAAGTGDALTGAAVMAAFWLGTVPILAALGLSVQGLRRLVGSKLPIVASAAMLVLGVATLAGRIELDARDLAQRVTAQQQTKAAVGAVPDTTTPPCCCGE